MKMINKQAYEKKLLDADKLITATDENTVLVVKPIMTYRAGKRNKHTQFKQIEAKVLSGITNSDNIKLSGWFPDNVNIMKHIFTVTGTYKQKSMGQITFLANKISLNSQTSLNLSQMKKTKPKAYQSPILSPDYKPEKMSDNAVDHIVSALFDKESVKKNSKTGRKQNLVPQTFIKKINTGLNSVQFMQKILHDPNSFLSDFKSDKMKDEAKERIKILQKRLKDNLLTPKKELMFLMQVAGFNISQRRAFGKNLESRCAKEYLKNPYLLLNRFTTLPTFTRCDIMALLLGHKSDDQNRYEALILAQVMQSASEGNICIKEDEVSKLMTRSKGLYELSAFANLNTDFLLSTDFSKYVLDLQEKNQLGVSVYNGIRYLYIKSDQSAETRIAKSILSRLSGRQTLNSRWQLKDNNWIYSQSKHEITDKEIDAFLDMYETKTGFKLAERQREAVHCMFNHKVMVLSGPAGSGKSGVTAALVEAIRFFFEKETKEKCDFDESPASSLIALAASTGRAAAQLTASVNKPDFTIFQPAGLRASTVHSLFHIIPGDTSDLRELYKPFLLIDETSMLDQAVTDIIFKKTMPNTHIVFIGDANQLPSVGSGTILKDMFDSSVVPVVELNHIFRQKEGSTIAINSLHIAHNEPKQISMKTISATDLNSDPLDEGCLWIKANDQHEINSTILKLVQKELKQGKNLNDIMVLSPEHRLASGVNQLNDNLKEILNPLNVESAQKEKQANGHNQQELDQLRVGDRVMETKNTYSKDITVLNGDLGKVISIEKKYPADFNSEKNKLRKEPAYRDKLQKKLESDQHNLSDLESEIIKQKEALTGKHETTSIGEEKVSENELKKNIDMKYKLINEITRLKTELKPGTDVAGVIYYGKVKIKFDSYPEAITFDKNEIDNELTNLHLGYVYSIHKSQGQQCDTVIVAIDPAHTFMINRELLYTAASRAVKHLIFVGSKKTFYIGMRKVSGKQRTTLLSERLNQEVQNV